MREDYQPTISDADIEGWKKPRPVMIVIVDAKLLLQDPDCIAPARDAAGPGDASGAAAAQQHAKGSVTG